MDYLEPIEIQRAEMQKFWNTFNIPARLLEGECSSFASAKADYESFGSIFERLQDSMRS